MPCELGVSLRTASSLCVGGIQIGMGRLMLAMPERVSLVISALLLMALNGGADDVSGPSSRTHSIFGSSRSSIHGISVAYAESVVLAGGGAGGSCVRAPL